MADGEARYPGYDVLSKWDTPSWNDATRRAIRARLAVEDKPEFFEPAAWATLKALCDRILPQADGPNAAPLAAYVDRKVRDQRGDGYRPANLPPLQAAWTRGLDALNAEAEAAHSLSFHRLTPHQQDALIHAMSKGELKHSAWGDMPSDAFFKDRAAPDIVRAYYAHPNAWSEMGFGGPASPRGYVRIDFDRRDPWEAAEARPGEDAATIKENSRVGR